jgi:pimeloyl-ACP methyl ester carboxylesterase
MSTPSPDLLSRLARARGIPSDARLPPRPGTLVTSDGVRLRFLDWEGGPETLILLHGGLLSAHTFDLFALALGQEYRCLALDLRGHGDSGWAASYPIERAVTDVCELVGHLDLRAPHLVGMSLGGCVAGHAAARLTPDLGSLTFIDVGPEVCFEATARMRAFLSAVGPVERIEDLVQRALAVSPRTDPDLMLYRYQSLLVQGPDGFVWKADRRRPTDFDHILGKLSELAGLAPSIPCPALVVKGGRSQVLDDAAAARFGARFPNGTWISIPGAGHNVQEDAPAALAEAVAALIGSSWRSQRSAPPTSSLLSAGTAT